MNKLHEIYQRFCDFSLAFKGNSPQTIRWYKQTFKSFDKHTGCNTVEDIQLKKIESWIFDGKINRKWSAKTIRNRLQVMSLFCDWLVDRKYIDTNLVKDIPRPRIPKRIPKHLSKEEAMQLLDWTKNFPYCYKFERTRGTAIIAGFLYTGDCFKICI